MKNNTTNAKSEFELNKEIYAKSLRGSYLILPVLIKSGKKFCEIGLTEIPISQNALEDKSKLITKRCNSGYIKKYLFEEDRTPYELYLTVEDITLSDFQLFMFDNGIGFISLLTLCENKDVSKIYNLVNNGYAGTDDKKSDSYKRLYDSLTEIISPNNLKIYLEREDINLLLNESYVFNFALTTKRFHDLETLRLLSENVHKQIGLERDFEDESETDKQYTFGARDVNKETYRWGCCISSLDISFVYACSIPEEREERMALVESVTECDLFLTILTMIQKYTCMKLNEDIHELLYAPITGTSKKHVRKSTIQKLKQQALEFRAFGTLAPSQISRWHNVCETYRCLLEAQGVDEALQEIEQKIDLIDSNQEQRIAEKQNMISAVIAIFGLISIVASILTIVDLVSTGSMEMVISFIASVSVIVAFGLYWFLSFLRR